MGKLKVGDKVVIRDIRSFNDGLVCIVDEVCENDEVLVSRHCGSCYMNWFFIKKKNELRKIVKRTTPLKLGDNVVLIDPNTYSDIRCGAIGTITGEVIHGTIVVKFKVGNRSKFVTVFTKNVRRVVRRKHLRKRYKRYDPQNRAEQKQASRDADERALATGEKTSEQLKRENGIFHGMKFRMDLSSVERLY